MGENSKIAWTHHTFSPWVGCQRVSPGCVHCYAETYDKRVGGVPKKQRADPNVAETRWGPNGRRTRTSVSNWKQPLKWDAAAKAAGERHRVFCSSLADVFEDRPELVQWRAELFELIATTPHLDWLLLTKRPENIVRLWPTAEYHGPDAKVWPHVWLGTTVEDQQRANERIRALLSVPAAVRFLSMEPLLEHVDLDRAVAVPGGEPCGLKCAKERGRGIDWIIIGGESGHGARSFHTEWARDLVDVARAAGVAAFVKQMGENAVGAGRDQLALMSMTDHGAIEQFPEDLRVREFPTVELSRRENEGGASVPRLPPRSTECSTCGYSPCMCDQQ